MGKISLLDCTLRDGGYVNDWKFGYDNLNNIFMRLVDAGVDIIEIGFLDDRRPFDIDRSIMPNTEACQKIYGKLDRKHAMIVGMIDYGTCDISNVQPCAESFLDGIRVIFKKHLMHEAMEYCRELKALGYKVFSQLVSITSYNDDELLELISLVNDVKPFAVSMVDTYGLLHPEDMLHYYQILEENVSLDIQIGFHAHNNFQLAYANALAFLGEERKHDIVVDGTLFGMGKSAGNAPLELLAMRLNDKFGTDYEINPMLESIQESILSFFAKTPWGYKSFFYLCGLNECHPNYLTFFEKKENFSVSKLNDLLSRIEPKEKKLLYEKNVAEKLYEEYMKNEGDDSLSKQSFLHEISEKKLLLVGPGKNIELQRKKVEQFVEKNSPYIVSINYLPAEMKVDCVFITKPSRYHELTSKMQIEENKHVKTLATTNVECRNGRFDFIINRAPLLEREEKIMDNSFLMLLKFLVEIGVKKVACAGFDGYSDKEDNYCNPSMEYSFIKCETAYLNSHMKNRISDLREQMAISFITYSAYDVEEDINGAAI